jgi:hypothetical protein
MGRFMVRQEIEDGARIDLNSFAVGAYWARVRIGSSMVSRMILKE